MTVSIIAAYSRNRVIGRDNRIPWRLPEDLRRFKRLTMGHHLILGRKTYESIGRPLPGRTMIVLTRNPAFKPPGVQTDASLEEALQTAADSGDDEAFIAGGEQIYRQALGIADRLHLTLIDEDFEGDAFFPEFEPGDWETVSDEAYAEPFEHRFVVLERRKGRGTTAEGAEQSAEDGEKKTAAQKG